MDATRFPIGLFEPKMSLSAQERVEVFDHIHGIAGRLRSVLRQLKPWQLDVPYRTGGWTIRQIVHHLADNDMNAYIRFRRALTEDEPMAGSYREDLWAEQRDYREMPVENSVLLMELLHMRFVFLLCRLKEEDFHRRLRTEVLGSVTLDAALQRFLWHNRHHMAQIEALIVSKGW